MKEKANKNTVRNEILAICKQNLPNYMILEEVVFVDDMPRTPRGKIDYRALEEQVTQQK